MKPGLFCRHRRRLRVALVLSAAAFLLYSCEPPASQLPASPNSAALEVPRISGLPNMAEIKRRLNDQYAASAKDTDGVEFDPPSISGTAVSAAIKYTEGKLLPMTIGGKDYEIKTVTITREVDRKTIPTTVEYKDKDDTTRKTVTSRYVPPPNAAANNARQGLEGGPQFAEAEAEDGRTLHISGEERDGEGNILRTFTATERTQAGTTTLKTTYRREGFTKTVTTENGIITEEVVTYSAGALPAEDETKTETITYENFARAMFYPAKAKRQRTVAVHKDADGNKTKTVKTTPTDEGGTEAVHKEGGKETLRIETKKDGSTITTKTTAEGSARELVIHSSVTKIGDYAFSDNDLTSVTIPPSVTAIGSFAFSDNQLTSLTIGNGVQTIGDYAFYKNKLTSVVIPPSVTAIGDNAFYVNQLTSLTIGNGVQTIGAWAFAKNPKLKTVRITGTGPVGSYAFSYEDYRGGTKGIFSESGSSGIELIIEDGITAIGEDAFRNNKLTSLTIGNGVQSIGAGAFAENPKLKIVRITGTGPVASNAFTYEDYRGGTKGIFSESGSSGIELIIEDGITAIGKNAFYNNQLTSLTIGNGVKTIGAGAFAENPTLKTVRITGTGPVESNAFTYIHTTLSYKGVFGESSSSRIELIIEDGITAIGERAFRFNDLTSLTIGNGVKTIERGAFSYNDLTSLSIPPSVTAIEEGAFYVNNLTSLTIGNGVKTIGEGAFGNNELTSLTIPPSVTSIGEGAFSGNLLTSVTLSEALYNARGDAFNGNPAHLPRTSPLFYDHKGRYLGTN